MRGVKAHWWRRCCARLPAAALPGLVLCCWLHPRRERRAGACAVRVWRATVLSLRGGPARHWLLLVASRLCALRGPLPACHDALRTLCVPHICVLQQRGSRGAPLAVRAVCTRVSASMAADVSAAATRTAPCRDLQPRPACCPCRSPHPARCGMRYDGAAVRCRRWRALCASCSFALSLLSIPFLAVPPQPLRGCGGCGGGAVCLSSHLHKALAGACCRSCAALCSPSRAARPAI